MVARTGEEFGPAGFRRLSFGDRVPHLAGGHVEGLEAVVGRSVRPHCGRRARILGRRAVSSSVSFEWE